MSLPANNKVHPSTAAVLLVEDDRRLAGTLQNGMQEHEFRVTLAHTAAAAHSNLQRAAYALIILDLGLPDQDGIDLLRNVRKHACPTPVLILTARDETEDKVVGLNAGADDYLTKPFAFSELLARARALLRRGSDAPPTTRLTVGDLQIDLLQRRVQRAGTDIALAPLEFDVLAFLANKAGSPVSREMLMREVWKIQSRAVPMNNVIDVLMTRLRDKLDKPFSTPLLHTLRGIGYTLRGQS